MKKKLSYIVIVMITCFGAIIYQPWQNSRNRENGFYREFASVVYKINQNLKLPSKTLYFLGYQNHKIYLKDITNPFEIYLTEKKIEKLKTYRLQNLDSTHIPKKKFSLSLVDTAIILSGNLAGKLTIHSIINNKKYVYTNPVVWFDQVEMLSNSTTIGRTLSTTRGTIDGRISKFSYKKGLIEKSYDLGNGAKNVFDIDGQLKLDNSSKTLYYLFYYSGNIVRLDSNLEPLLKFHTIDTVRYPKNKVAIIKPSGQEDFRAKTTLSSPRSIVHRSFTVQGEKLYVVSSLKADNEKNTFYRKNQVIDVYSSKNGKYLYSFYLSEFKNKQLRELQIVDSKLFGIFEDYLVSYQAQE